MKINLISIIPSKKIKRKIINKIKFSNKLNKFFLSPLKEFKVQGYTIPPMLFTHGKFAINLNFVPTQKELNLILDNFLFKFDLYIPGIQKKHIQNNIYLDKLYTINIFDNIDKFNNYDYIINLEKEECLKIFEPGFIECCLTLLNNNTDYIYIGDQSQSKCLNKRTYDQLVCLSEKEDVATLENCYTDKSNLECTIFSTKIVKERIKKIKQIKPSRKLLNKYLKNISTKVINYSTEFTIDVKKSYLSYFETSYNKFLKELLKYDTITFDIFDTLVTRTVLIPDDIFNIIERESKISMPESFLSIRKRAEQYAIKELQKDVSLDEIYFFMKKLNVLKNTDIDKLKELEVKYELKHIIPRVDMVKIYNELLNNNKNIDIISDMYLPESVIIKILTKCNIKNYRKLIVSNEVNMRKDSGALWDEYFEGNNEKTIHIGDNYNSDYIQVLKRQRKAIKILSCNECLTDSNIKKESNIDSRKDLAVLYNQVIFNSPFVRLKDYENNLKIYGEKLLSPIFYTFYNWFNSINQSKKILFVSREGYYLQPIYNKYCEMFEREKIDNVYFLTSRRAATIACCKNQKDILDLAKVDYNGTICNFFKNRYGVELDNIEDKIISLPKDYNMVESTIIDNQKLILENAKIERTEYLNYIKGICKNIKDNEFCIVDLGYSGTIQYYLSKLLNTKISGYYFAITNKKLPKKLGCEIKGCFNEDNNGFIDEENNFYRMALYLEAFLSAPEGQLIKFEHNNPVYKNGKYNKERKQELDIIYDGIVSGFEIYKAQKIKPFSIKTINYHYNFICELLKQCEGNLEKVLYLDDDYCRDGNELVKINKVFNGNN